jgi:predicted nucleotidyltransferase component of viral defense system
MNNKASSLKSSIEEFARRQGIDAEMDQNLVKEAIHLHLLSALSDAGILRHAVFQGGTALRLCYGGDRYSEDLDFVCGKAGSYFTDVEFKELIESALETTRKSSIATSASPPTKSRSRSRRIRTSSSRSRSRWPPGRSPCP